MSCGAPCRTVARRVTCTLFSLVWLGIGGCGTLPATRSAAGPEAAHPMLHPGRTVESVPPQSTPASSPILAVRAAAAPPTTDTVERRAATAASISARLRAPAHAALSPVGLPDFSSTHGKRLDSWRVTVAPEGVAGSRMTVGFHPRAPLHVKLAYAEQPPIHMPGGTEQDRHRAAVKFGFDTAVLGKALKLSGESDFSPFDPRTGAGFANPAQRMYKLSLRGNLGRLNYGARTNSTGIAFQSVFGNGDTRPKADHAERRVWAGWNFDRLNVSTFASQTWDNLALDPSRSRVAQQKAGVSLDYTFTKQPYLASNLSIAQGSSSQQPAGRRGFTQPVDSVDASLYYSGTSWDASLYSGLVRNSGSSNSPVLPVLAVTHYLTATYRPDDTLSITPTIALYDDYYGQDDTHSVQRSLALAFVYHQGKDAPQISLYGCYDGTRSTAWYEDSSNLYLNAGVRWPLTRRGSMRSTLSLEGDFNRYTDVFSPASDTDGFGLWLVLRVQPPFGGPAESPARRH